MFTHKNPFLMICETSVHAGSGSDLGIIDLPIQREKHTSYPKFESSGIKGVMRQYYRNVWDDAKLVKFFGPEAKDSDNDDSAASCLGFMDGRILLFPVKSVKGVFAYITCPDVLKRFQRDMEIGDVSKFSKLEEIPVNSICENSEIETKNNVILEEYAFENCKANTLLTEFAKLLADSLDGVINQYWADKISTDILVISNDDFADFVNLYCEVNARIKINQDTGTVEHGALWYEEFLPTDTVMYSILLTSPSFGKADKLDGQQVMNNMAQDFPEMVQMGGDATIGKGLMRTVLLGGKSE